MIKSFQIGAKKYTVRYLNHNSDNLGESIFPLNRIHVQTKWKGEDVPESSQEQTLFHEVVHAILSEMGRLDLSGDEHFVQTLSLLFHQFVRSVK